MRRHALVATAVIVWIALAGCTPHLPDARYENRVLAALHSQCLGRAFAARDSRAGQAFCDCQEAGYRAAFTPVELALLRFKEELHEHAHLITQRCFRVASIQGNYDDLLATIARKNTFSALAYFTQDFVYIDVRGHRHSADQMLAAIYARPGGTSAVTTLDDADKALDDTDWYPKRVTVERTTRERGRVLVRGRSRPSETATAFVDTWVDTDGALLLSKSVEQSVDTYVNGKLVSRVDAL
jgi:hypothetical protein